MRVFIRAASDGSIIICTPFLVFVYNEKAKNELVSTVECQSRVNSDRARCTTAIETVHVSDEVWDSKLGFFSCQRSGVVRSGLLLLFFILLFWRARTQTQCEVILHWSLECCIYIHIHTYYCIVMSRDDTKEQMESASEEDNTVALDNNNNSPTEVIDALREGTIGDSVISTANQLTVAGSKSASVVRIEAPEICK
jgi:hypothetical protein